MEDGLVTKLKYDDDKPYTPQIDSTEFKAAIEQFNKAVAVMKKAQALFPETPTFPIF